MDYCLTCQRNIISMTEHLQKWPGHELKKLDRLDTGGTDALNDANPDALHRAWMENNRGAIALRKKEREERLEREGLTDGARKVHCPRCGCDDIARVSERSNESGKVIHYACRRCKKGFINVPYPKCCPQCGSTDVDMARGRRAQTWPDQKFSCGACGEIFPAFKADSSKRVPKPWIAQVNLPPGAAAVKKAVDRVIADPDAVHGLAEAARLAADRGLKIGGDGHPFKKNPYELTLRAGDTLIIKVVG